MNFTDLFFVGARGHYNDLEFEILGHGEVDYKLTETRYDEDKYEIGKVFSTAEYYCLANNGQTWFWAIQGMEVYYCRQLSKEEVVDLGLEQEIVELSDTKIDPNLYYSFRHLKVSRKLILEEGGIGTIKDARGRGLNDQRQYPKFAYRDYSARIDGKVRHFSLDIFPNGEREWFETTWVNPTDLPQIFSKTLEVINNPKIDSNLTNIKNLAKLRSVIVVIFFVQLFLMLVSLIAAGNDKVFEFEKSFNPNESSSIELTEPVQITGLEKDKRYKARTEVTAPEGKGLSLEISWLVKNERIFEVESATILEFTNYKYLYDGKLKTSRSYSFEDDFYYKSDKQHYLQLRQLDYQDVGFESSDFSSFQSSVQAVQASSASSAKLDDPVAGDLDEDQKVEQVTLKYQIFQADFNFGIWTTSLFLTIILFTVTVFVHHLTKTSFFGVGKK